MHAVFFSVKRAHLRILARSRPVLVGAELTPARFDMLRVIYLHKNGVGQGKLCALLGVSGATVSRMLKALEERGLVTRERAYRDRRLKLVRITEFGITDVLTAIYMALRSGVVDQMAAAGATGERDAKAHASPSQDAVRAAETFLGRMRRAFDDPCRVRHPWRTGDLAPMGFTTLVGGRLHYQASA